MLFNIKTYHQLHVGQRDTGHRTNIHIVDHDDTHCIEKVANEKDLGFIIGSSSLLETT